MQVALHLLTLATVLLVTLAVGVFAHELLHLLGLSFTDAEYTVTVLPDAGESSLQNAVASGLVRVEITRVPDSTPDWMLRVAALLPVLLALPLALVLAGELPDPIAAGDHAATVALVALTGCGLPSPADWSVVWYGSELAET
jgi:hypothetical protein